MLKCYFCFLLVRLWLSDFCRCHLCFWTLVCLRTGFHGLQGVDASRHHKLVTNSHGMFRPFKTMTPYCWHTHSEYDDVSHCVSWDFHSLISQRCHIQDEAFSASSECCHVTRLLSAMSKQNGLEILGTNFNRE